MHSLWMLVAALLFSVMGVCVKLAGGLYHTGEIVFYRGAIGVVGIWLVMRANGRSLRSAYYVGHAKRGIIGVTALVLWFYSITLLPLATAITLNYTSSIWVAVLLAFGAYATRGRKLDARLVLAILISFAGVLCLLQPSIERGQLIIGLIGLISGLLSGLAYLQVRELGLLGEPEPRIVFYFSATGMIAGAIWIAFAGFHRHTPYGFALLLGVGLSATAAQIAMTRAYKHGNTLVTANLQYMGIVFASVWGIALWDDHPSALSFVGVLLIIGSGIATTLLRARPTPAGIEAAEVMDDVAEKDDIPSA